MRFTTKTTILGMKANKGVLDNGTKYDSTKVYIQTSLDESKENYAGYTAAEMSFGTSENFSGFKHLTYPFVADVTIESVSSGKQMRNVILAVKPLEIAKKAA